jgi:hypothetical protein
MIDRKIFFDRVRKDPFGGELEQSQVDGLNAILDDKELGLWDDRSCYGNPANALLPDIAAQVLFEGMMEGWFRADDLGPHTLGRYFGATANDPYGAREIINGDKAIVPDWSDGLSIGALVADYHHAFLRALETSSSAPILAYIYTLVIRSESPVTIDFLGGPHGS